MRDLGADSTLRPHVAAARHRPLTLAELLGLAAVVALATALTATYLLDRAGFGVAPRAGASLAAAMALATAVGLRGRARAQPDEAFLFLVVGVTAFGYLLWLA